MPDTSNSIETTEGRTTPGSIPLYIAAYCVALSSLMSMGLLLDEDPGFISLVIGLTAIGFVVSFLIRRQSINAYSVELPAAAFCVLLAIAATTDRGIPFLAPIGLEGDRAKTLAVMLTWITVFRSFTLITDSSVLFSCVLAIAIMGLVGTMSADPTLLRYFSLFVTAAAFMMVHESFLSARRRQAGRKKPRQSRLFLSQVQAALICAVGALMLAMPVAAPLQALGSLLAFTPSTPGVTQQQQASQNTQRINIQEQPAITVGTGPISLSDQQVMRIRANQGSYWRGATFNVYTGRGWSSSLDEMGLLETDTTGETGDIFSEPSPDQPRFNFRVQPTEFTAGGPGSYDLNQRIRFVGNGLFQDIYGAPEIKSLTMTEDRAQLDKAGGIHLFRPVQNFDYSVRSRVPDTAPETLRAASTDYSSAIREHFLGSLDTANPASTRRMKEAADDVARGKRTVYDKVMALKEWVEGRCKYNIGTRAYPVDVDVAEYFLFTAKEGYCDSFATSLAMLCRAAGIPSRVASGFAPGRYEAESQEYVIAERDKHLWTEVYFPNVGWVTFDATEGAEDISDRGGQNKNKNSISLLGLLFSKGPLPPLALLIMICLLAYVFKVEVWDRYRPRRLALEHLGLPVSNLLVIEAYDSACKSLARLGRPRMPSVTPGEYLLEMRGALSEYPEAAGIFEQLTIMVVTARYSKSPITDANVEAARALLPDLRKALRPVRRNAFTAPRPASEPA